MLDKQETVDRNGEEASCSLSAGSRPRSGSRGRRHPSGSVEARRKGRPACLPPLAGRVRAFPAGCWQGLRGASWHQFRVRKWSQNAGGVGIKIQQFARQSFLRLLAEQHLRQNLLVQGAQRCASERASNRASEPASKQTLVRALTVLRSWNSRSTSGRPAWAIARQNCLG